MGLSVAEPCKGRGVVSFMFWLLLFDLLLFFSWVLQYIRARDFRVSSLFCICMGWWSGGQERKEVSAFEKWRSKIESFFLTSYDHLEHAQSLHPAIPLVLCSSISLAIGFRLGRRRPFWQQLKSLQDLRSSDIGPKASSWRGKVVSVADGDTIRFVHRPTLLSTISNDKDSRLNIRLCTIDTPETGKTMFGKTTQGQPFGEEAKANLQKLCDQTIVDVKFLQIDQYGRGVAEVKVPGWLWWSTYLDEQMLKDGLAEVYTGSGAVYGRLGKEKYLAIMDKAKFKGKGIWSDSQRETAAEYKRRTK